MRQSARVSYATFLPFNSLVAYWLDDESQVVGAEYLDVNASEWLSILGSTENYIEEKLGVAGSWKHEDVMGDDEKTHAWERALKAMNFRDDIIYRHRSPELEPNISGSLTPH